MPGALPALREASLLQCFALGDRHYEQFCKFGVDLDAKLAALGANCICNRVECDVDVDEPFAQWKASLLPRLQEIGSGAKAGRVVLFAPCHSAQTAACNGVYARQSRICARCGQEST